MRCLVVAYWLLLGLVVPALGVAQVDGGPSDDGSETVEADSGDLLSDGAVEEIDGGSGRQQPEPDTIPQELLPRVEASLEVEEVELGQVLPMSITVHSRPGARVHLKQLREIGPFELLDSTRREEAPSEEGDAPSIVMELELITFEVGQLEVPPVELMVVLRDGRTGSVETPILTVLVTDPLANENDPQPRADHPPRSVMTTDQRALWAFGIGGALLLAILLGMVIGKLRSRRRPKPAPPPPPPRPPEEVALEKLEAIERSDWLEEGEIKTYHIAVSEAVREYLGGRYEFDSLELTTTELLLQLDAVTIRGVTRNEIESFLFETDLVKFAKWRPDDEWSKGQLEEAYRIVRKTTSAAQIVVPTTRPKEKERQGESSESTSDEAQDDADHGGSHEAS